MSASPTTPTQPRAAQAAESLRILDGDCWAFFAFDVGYGIDLNAAENVLAATSEMTEETRRKGIAHQRRAPHYLQFKPAPLKIDQPAAGPTTLDLAGFRAAPRVECTLYDFGAISVAYRIPLTNHADMPDGVTLGSLVDLSYALADQSVLLSDAQRCTRDLIRRLESAIERPMLIDIVEDYTVYHVRRWTPDRPTDRVVSDHSEPIARLLLAERGHLSPQTVESALSAQLSYSPADVAVIDWNAALVLDEQAEDALAVLEFANVELLEMRFLDDRLDSILDRSYSSVLKRDEFGRLPRSKIAPLFDPHRSERRRVAALQMESAMLFEGINNALKLVGDQHLARLYALAARRLHLAEWDQSILRKLHTADGLYQKLADEHAVRRMEVLEWIIIILIAFEGILPFIWHGAK